MDEIEPQQIAIRYNPPKISVIYNLNGECYFHEISIEPHDMKMPSNKLFEKLDSEHRGYFDNVDIQQICKMLDLIKNNQSNRHPSDSDSF